MDVDDIPAGVDFRGVLREATAKCDVMLVIIGKSWLNISDKAGKRRLDDPNDFVRLEVETGLQRDRIPVIPVLVNGASMPPPDALPLSIRQLAFKNAVTLRNPPDFKHDLERLVKQLASLGIKRRSWLRYWPIAALAIIALVLAVVLLPNLSSGSEPDPTQSVAVSTTIAPSVTPLPTHTHTDAPPSPTVQASATLMASPTTTPRPASTDTSIPPTPTSQASATPEPIEPETPNEPKPTLTEPPTAAPAAPFEPTTAIDPITGRTTVYVPSGIFRDENGSSFQPFWIDAYEVTNGQFLEFVLERGVSQSAQRVFYDINATDAAIVIGTGTYTVRDGLDDHPVVNVTWDGAREYCSWIDGQLPSATELHKAAVWNPATETALTYPWGDAFDPAAANIEGSGLMPVGSYPSGVSPVGAYDVIGNASEWTSGARGFNRFYTGGDYSSTWRTLQIGTLQQASDGFQSATVGFRCVYPARQE